MSVTAPRGFAAAGVAAGIKPSGEPDLALVLAERPVAVGAVFTRSLTAAPPVIVSRQRAAGGEAVGVIINSGCANAGTGPDGTAAALTTTAAAAGAMGVDPESLLVCSTGTIGDRLPVDTYVAALPGLIGSLGRTPEHGTAAATAIMTTDSRSKEALAIGEGFTVGGMAKGAGMIRPDMATMLAVLTTDAIVPASLLQDILGSVVDVTFNCLNVDGCQSTNDTVVVLASGESGVRPGRDEVAAAIEAVCRDLQHQMAVDAEGASKVVTIEVTGAADDLAARRLGMSIADSALVRSSFFGADPNWGRIFGALGVAGVTIDPDAIAIGFNGTWVASGGHGLSVDDDELAASMKGDFTVEVSVGDGPGAASILTTDLTPDYVRFNGERS